MKKQGYGNNRIRRAQEAAKRFTIVAVCVVTAALLGGCSATFLAHSGDVRLDNKNSSNARSNNAQAQNLPKITEIDEPQGTYQIDANYPTAADDPSFDASLITNDTASFTAFKDQGKLLFKAERPDAFQIFVNGVELPINQAKQQQWYEADISQITVNGNNQLQVTNLLSSASEKANQQNIPHLEIKIPYPTVLNKTAEYTHNEALRLLDDVIQSEVEHGFTAAQYALIKDGQLVGAKSFGLCNSYAQDGTRLVTGDPVTNDTLFDIASNTKMYATNYALQKLASDGLINIHKRVQDYIPEFRDQAGDAIKGKDDLTIKEVLEHQAGFPADPQYHNEDYSAAADKTIPGSNANSALYTQSRNEALTKIIATPLEYKPGTKTRYSDVDYMLLGFLVERVTGQRLSEYVKQEFYEPLGLTHTTFNPLQNGFHAEDIAATELNGNTRDGAITFNNIRTNTIQGEVHDEKAYYTMDGVSGHAGLFSTATELATLAQIIDNGGGYANHQFFKKDVLDQFIKPKDTNASYGLGWRREGDNLYGSYFSLYADAATVGHTGWTGTLTLIDPIQHLVFVMLTNVRNSAVLNPEKNTNDFFASHFLAGNYGFAATMAFSFEHSSAQAANALLLDLITQKYNEIQSDDAHATTPDKDDLAALLAVARARSYDATVKTFMSSEAWAAAEDLCGSKDKAR